MSKTPDWETPAQEHKDMADMRENIMAMVSAWCVDGDDDDLQRLHEYLRLGEEV